MENFKYVISYIWNDKFLRYCLGASLIIVIFMIFYASTAKADSYNKCIAECIVDTTYLQDCILDEKQFWDSGNASTYRIKRSCRDLIRNEREYCYEECTHQTNWLLKYYDNEVKNFSETN